MWKFRAFAVLLALAAPPLRADFLTVQREVGDLEARNKTLEAQRARLRSTDSEELRAAIDYTQALFDALALESGLLDAAAHKALYVDLRDGSKLPQAVDDARKALELAEELVKVKSGIKGQQQRLAAAAEADKDAEESRLLGLQSDLLGLVEDLRKRLRGLHKELGEEQLRDLRNWAMINEGILRRQHEEAELRAAAQKEAEALPIDAGAMLPQGLKPADEPVPAAVSKSAKGHGKPR